MEDTKQAQAGFMSNSQNTAQPQPTPQEQPGATMGTAQPQPGGLYQFVPGAGFVQVQAAPQGGAAAQPGAAQNPLGAQGAQADMGANASAQQGMFGQGTPEGAEAQFDQNKIGQMYGVMNDVMNGEADPAKIMSLFQSTDGDFWKGAIVGAAGAFLIGNETVRNTIAGVFGSMFSPGDPEGPQVTVDEPAKAKK